MHGSWRNLVVRSLLLTTIVGPLWAPTIARATTAGWTGAAAQGDWSLGANWTTGTVPNASDDQADFNDLGEPCDNQVLNGTPSGQGCYSVEDDAGIVQLGELWIDNRWPYTLAPANSNDRIELTQPADAYGSLAAGPDSNPLDAQPTAPVSPDISIPVVAMNDQTWSVQGYPDPQSPNTLIGLEADDISGLTANLSLDLTGPLYTTSVTTRSLTVGGGGFGNHGLVVEPNPTDPADQPELPAAGTNLVGSGALAIDAPGTQSGPIVAAPPYIQDSGFAGLTVGDGDAPDGTLDVTGDVDVYDTWGGGSLGFYIDGAASIGSTPTPSLDYAQLVATGDVELGGLYFTLSLGSDTDGNCQDLVPGQIYTLVSAAAISGELVDASDDQPLPDGSVVSLQNQCDSWVGPTNNPTVRINYNTSSTPETVTATVVSGGHAGDFPMLTGASPQISGLVSGAPYAGVPLDASTGQWSGNPTGYDYTWYSCTPDQGPDCDNIVGDDLSTYTPTPGDVGNTIEVCVDATNGYGSNADQYCSDPTSAVEVPPVPELTQGAVTITGSDQIGDSLTTNPASWSWFPSFAYQWQRCTGQAGGCTDITGASAATYLLTAADVGQFVRVKLTASDAGGSTVAYSATSGQIQGGPAKPLTVVVEPSKGQVSSALSAIAHASGALAVRRLIKTRSFTTSFDAPGSGVLKVTWTTRIRTGPRNHRRHRNVEVASGAARASSAGAAKLVMRLTARGRALLRANPAHLMIIATEKFQPSGGVWTTVTKRFRL